MINHKLRHLPLAAAALVACAGAHAGYQSPDGNFTLSGFGTLGAVSSSTNDVEFNYPGQGGGAGTKPSLSPDSKLAVQGTYKFTPTLSATGQVMTKYDASSQYQPNMDWLFAKWQATPGLNVRLGRMGAPFFMVSDFRNVGYANTTVRPNLDVYGQVPTDRFEGIDASYQYNLGATTLNATAFFGDAKDDYTSAFRKGATVLGPSVFELKRLKGLNLTAEMDNGLTLRAGYLKSKINLTSDSVTNLSNLGKCLSATTSTVNACAAGGLPIPDTLLPGAPYLRSIGAQTTSAANAAAVTQNKNISFMGFGFTYDQDDLIISGEFTKRKSDSFVSDTTGWYANLGYRVGKFTPYVGLSRLSVNSANVTAQPIVAGQVANPSNNAQLDQLNGGLRSVASLASSGLQSFLNVEKLAQHTYTVGSRWDVMPNVALKAQWDQIHKPADSWGLFFTPDPSATNAQAFLNKPRKVNVLSVSMDVVF